MITHYTYGSCIDARRRCLSCLCLARAAISRSINRVLSLAQCFLKSEEMALNSLLLASLCLLVCSHGLPAVQLSKKIHNGAITTEKLQEANTIMVNLTGYMYEVSDQFLSVTIDAGNINNNWDVINFTAPRIINMAKALAPAMLRVGGTYQDFLIFVEGSTKLNQVSNFTMNTTQWDAVNMFVEAVGWDFIFGLNALLRGSDGSWDGTNAEELMTYTTSKGYKVNWELGNGTKLNYCSIVALGCSVLNVLNNVQYDSICTAK